MVSDLSPAHLFAALAVPRRRYIVELLSTRGQLSATAISQEFQVSAAAISQHLKVLKQAELVRMEKQAQQRFYRLNPQALDEVADWAQDVKAHWNARFNKLDQLLK